MSAGQISALLIIWSTTSFLFEVPSGAWADIVDRRRLLMIGAALYAAGFATWVIWPTFPGFALGFVLWGLSGALASGTFEAFVYDELAAHRAEGDYTRLIGVSRAVSMIATMVGIALGGPLFRAGGYALVGWVSVGVALIHGVLAWALPRAPRTIAIDDVDDVDDVDETASGYVATLRAGIAEAVRYVPVRQMVFIVAVLMGVSAYDEYFGLLARENGAATGDIPVLMALVTAGQVVGTALAGRAERLGGGRLATVVLAAGVAIAAGALAGHPAGFVAIAVGYGAIDNASVVSEAKLQSRITGRARATVTSASGLLAEVFAVACYGLVAVVAVWFSYAVAIAILCTPLVLIAAAIRRWSS